MRKKISKKYFTVLLYCAMLNGCAAWEPRVANPDQSYTSHLDGCIQKIGGRPEHLENVGLGAGVGALAGVAVGAALGADLSSTATMGAMMGAGSNVANEEIKFKTNLINCLRSRGYEVYP